MAKTTSKQAEPFTEEQLAAIREAIERITAFGGHGELVIVVQRGKIRYINHMVSVDLLKEDNSNHN